MEIKTQRLTLRPVQMEDVPTVHAYSSDWESLPYMVCLPYEVIEETAFYAEKRCSNGKRNSQITASFPF